MNKNKTTREVRLQEAFPLNYAHWYAATLFLGGGRDKDAVFDRLGVREDQWRRISWRYDYLHAESKEWLESIFSDQRLLAPSRNEALYAHLTQGEALAPSIRTPFDFVVQMQLLRRLVERQPRVGPFTGVDWTAILLAERHFPNLRYVSDGIRVHANGKALHDRRGVPIDGIDTKNFRQLGERWFCDGHRVYGQACTAADDFWSVAVGADAQTFKVVNQRYGLDAHAAYDVEGTRFPLSDPGSFEIVDYERGPDGERERRIYLSDYARCSRKVYAFGKQVEGAHAPSFRAISVSHGYFADRNRVYWRGNPIFGADLASFECAPEVGRESALDKFRPYNEGVAGSSTTDFPYWADYFAARPTLSGYWWHAEKARRELAPPATQNLVPLGGPFLSDGRRVLVVCNMRPDYGIVALDGIDHDSFRHLVGVFGADRHGLHYVRPEREHQPLGPVPGVDAEGFEALGGGWFRDRHRAYYYAAYPGAWREALVIVKADMASFRHLGGAYALDCRGLIVEGTRKRGIVDAASVVPLDFRYARLGRLILYRGNAVARPGKIEPSTARAFHRDLLMDAEGHMLFRNAYRKPIKGLDPSTFRFIATTRAADANHIYDLTDHGLMLRADLERSMVMKQLSL